MVFGQTEAFDHGEVAGPGISNSEVPELECAWQA